jgi:hypothetical protein
MKRLNRQVGHEEMKDGNGVPDLPSESYTID